MSEVEKYPRVIPFDDGTKELKIYQETTTDVGGVVWDSALMAIHYFFKNPILFEGKKILELGSGTGVCGIALAALGAEVIVTDLPERIPLLESNIEVNRTLVDNRIRAQVLDWSTDTIPSGLDLILAVDCVYYNSSIDPLVNLLNCSDALEIIIVSEMRDLGQPLEAQKLFFKNIDYFFRFSPIPKSELDPEYESDDIIIGKLIRTV